MRGFIKFFAVIPLLAAMLCCQPDTVEQDIIARAEALMPSRPDSALLLLRQISPRQSTPQHADWCALRVWAEYRTYQPETDESALQTAFNYYASRDNAARKALVYYLRAVIHEEKKIGTEADWMDDLRRGCVEAERTDAHFLAAQLFHRYGIGLQKRDRLDEAVGYLGKYLRRAELSDSHTDQIIALINLSNLSLQRNRPKADYAEAISYAQAAVSKARTLRMQTELGKALGQLSICCGHAKQYEAALQYAIQAKDIDEHQYLTGERKEMVRYVRIADAHRKLCHADSAIFYARKNLHHPTLSIRMNAVQMLYMVYRDLVGDYKESMRYMHQFQMMKDTLAQTLQSEQLLRREMTDDKAQALAKQQRGYSYLLLAGVAVFVAVAVLLLVYRARLKHSGKMLAESTTRLSEQQEHEQLLTDELVSTNELISGLHEAPHYLTEADWQQLRSVTEKAYPSFLSTLKSRHPYLTEVDMQVALLMKLRFSGSQIASMLAVSPTSVTKQKQRMKKRLIQSDPSTFGQESTLDAYISSL